MAERIHSIERSDADRHFHDHPCASISVILWGGYWEVMPERRNQPYAADVSRYVRKWRGPGAIVFRRARSRHRLELPAARERFRQLVAGMEKALVDREQVEPAREQLKALVGESIQVAPDPDEGCLVAALSANHMKVITGSKIMLVAGARYASSLTSPTIRIPLAMRKDTAG